MKKEGVVLRCSSELLDLSRANKLHETREHSDKETLNALGDKEKIYYSPF